MRSRSLCGSRRLAEDLRKTPGGTDSFRLQPDTNTRKNPQSRGGFELVGIFDNQNPMWGKPKAHCMQSLKKCLLKRRPKKLAIPAAAMGYVAIGHTMRIIEGQVLQSTFRRRFQRNEFLTACSLGKLMKWATCLQAAMQTLLIPLLRCDRKDTPSVALPPGFAPKGLTYMVRYVRTNGRL